MVDRNDGAKSPRSLRLERKEAETGRPDHRHGISIQERPEGFEPPEDFLYQWRGNSAGTATGAWSAIVRFAFLSRAAASPFLRGPAMPLALRGFSSNRTTGGIADMRKYWVGQAMALVAAAAFSPGLCAQTMQKTDAKAPAAGQAVAKTADGVPDFSGVWEGHMPPSARKYAGYSFTGMIPEMTPYGKSQYEMTKPSWGPRAVEDSTDMVNPTTGNEIGCFPT